MFWPFVEMYKPFGRKAQAMKQERFSAQPKEVPAKCRCAWPPTGVFEAPIARIRFNPHP
jgi:hypothetical protein